MSDPRGGLKAEIVPVEELPNGNLSPIVEFLNHDAIKPILEKNLKHFKGKSELGDLARLFNQIPWDKTNFQQKIIEPLLSSINSALSLEKTLPQNSTENLLKEAEKTKKKTTADIPEFIDYIILYAAPHFFDLQGKIRPEIMQILNGNLAKVIEDNGEEKVKLNLFSSYVGTVIGGEIRCLFSNSYSSDAEMVQNQQFMGSVFGKLLKDRFDLITESINADPNKTFKQALDEITVRLLDSVKNDLIPFPELMQAIISNPFVIDKIQSQTQPFVSYFKKPEVQEQLQKNLDNKSRSVDAKISRLFDLILAPYTRINLLKNCLQEAMTNNSELEREIQEAIEAGNERKKLEKIKASIDSSDFDSWGKLFYAFALDDLFDESGKLHSELEALLISAYPELEDGLGTEEGKNQLITAYIMCTLSQEVSLTLMQLDIDRKIKSNQPNYAVANKFQKLQITTTISFDKETFSKYKEILHGDLSQIKSAKLKEAIIYERQYQEFKKIINTSFYSLEPELQKQALMILDKLPLLWEDSKEAKSIARAMFSFNYKVTTELTPHSEELQKSNSARIQELRNNDWKTEADKDEFGLANDAERDLVLFNGKKFTESKEYQDLELTIPKNTQGRENDRNNALNTALQTFLVREGFKVDFEKLKNAWNQRLVGNFKAAMFDNVVGSGRMIKLDYITNITQDQAETLNAHVSLSNINITNQNETNIKTSTELTGIQLPGILTVDYSLKKDETLFTFEKCNPSNSTLKNLSTRTDFGLKKLDEMLSITLSFSDDKIKDLWSIINVFYHDETDYTKMNPSVKKRILQNPIFDNLVQLTFQLIQDPFNANILASYERLMPNINKNHLQSLEERRRLERRIHHIKNAMQHLVAEAQYQKAHDDFMLNFQEKGPFANKAKSVLQEVEKIHAKTSSIDKVNKMVMVLQDTTALLKKPSTENAKIYKIFASEIQERSLFKVLGNLMTILANTISLVKIPALPQAAKKFAGSLFGKPLRKKMEEFSKAVHQQNLRDVGPSGGR